MSRIYKSSFLVTREGDDTSLLFILGVKDDDDNDDDDNDDNDVGDENGENDNGKGEANGRSPAVAESIIRFSDETRLQHRPLM
jgi:hypothetical protein